MSHCRDARLQKKRQRHGQVSNDSDKIVKQVLFLVFVLQYFYFIFWYFLVYSGIFVSYKGTDMMERRESVTVYIV